MNPDLYQELVRQINSLQKQVDGLVKPEVGRWVSWTPTVTQGVAVAVTVTFARYITLTDAVLIEVALAVTGAGTVGSIIVIAGIPTAIVPANTIATNMHTVGVLNIQDTSAGLHYIGALIATGAPDFKGLVHNTAFFMGANPNFGLANGDFIGFTAKYER